MTYAEDNEIIQNWLNSVALPATGGAGTSVFYAAGAGLVLLAVLGFVFRKKRNKGTGIR